MTTSIDLSFESGESSLSVRRFAVKEAVSTLFTIAIEALSPNHDLDLEEISGRGADFRLDSGFAAAPHGGIRRWKGIVSSIDHARTEVKGLSSYELRIVPALALLTLRRNHRIFQHVTVPDIAEKLLQEAGVPAVWSIDRGEYPKLEYRVQHGETDFVFLSRLLEESGISFYFSDEGDAGSLLTFSDHLHTNAPRSPIPFVDKPPAVPTQELVTRVRLSANVRPGVFVLADTDPSNPFGVLVGRSSVSPGIFEHRFENYFFQPGASLVHSKRPSHTPVADDKGVVRAEQKAAARRAEILFHGERLGGRGVSYETDTIELAPGTVLTIENHPRAQITDTTKLLAIDFSIEGGNDIDWKMSGRAAFTDQPFRTPMKTPKAQVMGMQNALVVGPKGQDIHTDETGRVRVQFPWDREGKSNENSSCWMRVSQGWAGAGFGSVSIPRVGQEVLVAYMGGDPDQPVIVGRVFNHVARVPHKLPEHKTRSAWRSDSTPGSNGYNEIMFEDAAGKEVVHIHAQKNFRKTVKHHETVSIGGHRKKVVKAGESVLIVGSRAQAAGDDATDFVGRNSTTTVGNDLNLSVKGDENHRIEGTLRVQVGQTEQRVVKGNRVELVNGDANLTVNGSRRRRVKGSESLIVEDDRHERVGRKHALEAGVEIHLKSGRVVMIESSEDLTIKGPGGFIRIDSSGITIKGKMVRINSGGTPGSGSGGEPEEPELPTRKVVARDADDFVGRIPGRGSVGDLPPHEPKPHKPHEPKPHKPHEPHEPKPHKPKPVHPHKPHPVDDDGDRIPGRGNVAPPIRTVANPDDDTPFPTRQAGAGDDGTFPGRRPTHGPPHEPKPHKPPHEPKPHKPPHEPKPPKPGHKPHEPPADDPGRFPTRAANRSEDLDEFELEIEDPLPPEVDDVGSSAIS